VDVAQRVQNYFAGLLGGELAVLERLNEPSVAGWLRGQFKRRVMPTQQAGPVAAASKYYQPRPNSPAHAHRNLTSLSLSLLP
jgi:hypothetical protein